mgnify:CR=1 FL=1
MKTYFEGIIHVHDKFCSSVYILSRIMITAQILDDEAIK